MARHTVAERRAQLIAVGKAIFAASPYDAVSTDEIAARAGISKGLLYHYFPGKRAFYVATVRQLAADLLAAVPLDPALAPADATRVGLDGFLDFIEHEGDLYRALLRGGVGVDAEVTTIIEGVRQALLGRLFAVMGIATPSPVEHLRLYGWLGFVESTSLVWIAERGVDRATLRGVWLAALPSRASAP
jgi:AcrR family transcriptional regulator